ncbi:MAG: phage tail tip lysozyme [Methylocella sp.]
MALVNIPQQGMITAEDPTSRVSGGDVTRSADFVAQGAEQFGQGLEDDAVPLAQQAGEQAVAKAARSVSRDANGQIQIQTPETSFILGRAGDEYEHVVVAGAIANGQNQTTQDMNDLRVQHAGDPVAFKTAANGYIDHLRAQYGDDQIANTLVANAEQMATQHYDSLVNTKAALDTSDAKSSIQAQIQSLQNDLGQLARQGGTDTPEFVQKSGQLHSYFDSLQANPLFQMPKAVVDGLRSDLNIQLTGEAIVGHMDYAYDSQGLLAAQKQLHDSVDHIQGVTDAQRNQLVAQGESRLQFLQGQDAIGAEGVRRSVTALTNAVQSGNHFDPAVYDSALAQAQQYHVADAVAQIQSLKAIAGIHAATNNLSPLQSAAAQGVGGPIAGALGNEAQAMQYFQSKGWTPAQAAGIVGNLVHESGGRLDPNAVNPGDGSDGSNSIGIGQWNADRAQALKAFAAAQGKPMNDYATQLAFVQHELETTHAGAAAALRATNDVAGAAAAVALKYEIPAGAETGVAANVNGWQNRLDQATRLAGGNVSSASVNGTPFTREQMQANPFLLSTWVQKTAADQGNQTTMATALGSSIERSLQNGITPSPTVVANYVQLTEGKAQFSEQRQNIMSTIEGQSQANAALAMAPSAGQSYMDQVKAQAQGGSNYQGLVAQHAQELFVQGQRALRDDPGGTAVAKGWVRQSPAPLDFSQPDSIASGIAARSQVVSAIAARQPGASLSAVFPNEIDRVKNVVENGPLDQRMGLMGTISNLPEAQQKATLAAIGQTGKAGQIFTVAGSVNRYAPAAAATDIVQGAALLQTEPRLAPKAADIQTNTMRTFPANDFPSPAIRGAVQNAAEAYYAAQSAKAGDTSQVFNSDRWKSSVDAVTGGVVSYRGSNVIAPTYGANAGQLQAAIIGLTDDDFKGVHTADGSTFPARALKPSISGNSSNWRLESRGEGTYRVFSGDDKARQYLQNADGGAFVLDLRSAMNRPSVGQYLGDDTSNAVEQPPMSLASKAGGGFGAPSNNRGL